MSTKPNTSQITYDTGSNKQDLNNILDTVVPIADYTALRNYTGRATQVRITADGIAGVFKHDSTDITSTDNGGTIIVSGTKRWKRHFDGSVNVMWFGAKGDGVTDDTLAIQTAINSAIGSVYFPEPTASYKITDSLIIDKLFLELKGDGEKTRIVNVGYLKPAIKIYSSYNAIGDMSIWGNGNAFGAAATTSHGIEFIGARNWHLSNLNIRYHGGNGIHCTGGVWVTSIDKCEIAQNYGDGINCVSPSGDALDQNGNNFSLTNSTVACNTGNGLNWKASALHVSGTVLEANKMHGLLVDCTGKTNSAYGINIVGNYTENNILGELKFISVSGTVMAGVHISGNYFYSIQNGPVAAITFAGPARSAQSVFIAGNSFVKGGTVLNLVDGGNCFRESCKVYAGEYNCVNMANASLSQLWRTDIICGAYDQTGVEWVNPAGPSSNFFSASSVNIYFKLNLSSNDLLLDIKFFVTSNATAAYSVSAFLKSRNVTTSDAAVTVFSATLQSDAGGGNKLFTFTPYQSTLPVRADMNKLYYLHLIFSPPSTGSLIQMNDPVMRVV